QTAQDMRITAQQVVKDIDAARGELKRAILDLPDETRNNADAMRRVVSDQIAALNALADVVKRQTGTVDFSGPGISSAGSLREPPLGKSEGAPVQAPQNGPASAPKKPERSEGPEDNKGLRDRILTDLGRSSARIASVPEIRSRSLPGEIEALVDKLNATA